jgi:hypothetical protein
LAAAKTGFEKVRNNPMQRARAKEERQILKTIQVSSARADRLAEANAGFEKVRNNPMQGARAKAEAPNPANNS